MQPQFRALLGLFAVVGASRGILAAPQQPETASPPETGAEVAVAIQEEAPGPRMHGTIGNDFTSAYYFRGIFQENQGAIAEPYLDLGMPLFESDGEIRAIDLHFGQWNSLHDGPSGTAGPQSMWYENDLYVGLEITGDQSWSLGTTYTNYYSPNSRFGTVQEIAVSLAYDDGDRIAEGFSGLQPHVLVAFETSGRADAAGGRGIYGEFGICPKFDLGNLGTMEVTLELPLELGISLGDYYESSLTGESSFGYLDFGAVLRAPLSFLSNRVGPWEGSIGVHALALGRSNEEQNSGSDFEVVITGGFSTTF